MRSSVGIQRDLHGNSLTLHGFAQKSLGGVDVTVPTQVEIDRLPSLVDRPIQVHPFAAHLHVRLIPAPGAADRAGVAFPPLLELRTVMLHPPQNRGVCYVDAALTHHRHQVAIAQLEAEIPANAQNHDLLVKMPTFEQLFDRYESWHLSIIA